MTKFDNLLVMALVIIRRIHKAHIIDRGAQNSTGPKLPDFTLVKIFKNSSVLYGLRKTCQTPLEALKGL